MRITILTADGTASPSATNPHNPPSQPGGYPQSVALAMDRSLWDWIPIDYNPTPLSLYPLHNSVDRGVNMTIDGINSFEGPFVLSGLSQGAVVMSLVYNEIRYGSLQSRRNDLISAVMFGNPMREAGHYAGNFDPGGQGFFGDWYDYPTNLVDTEPFWIEYANPGDPAACQPATQQGHDVAAGLQFVWGDFGGGGVAALVGALLGSVTNPLAVAQAILSVFSLTGIVGGKSPHSKYAETYTPSGTGKSALQLAIEHLIEVQNSPWVQTPVDRPLDTRPGWWETPPPPVLSTAPGWWSEEAASAAQLVGGGSLGASIRQRSYVPAQLGGEGAVTILESAQNIIVPISVPFSDEDTSATGGLYQGLSAWGYTMATHLVYFGGDGLLYGDTDGLRATAYSFVNEGTVYESGDGVLVATVFQKYAVAAAFSSESTLGGTDISSTQDGLSATGWPAMAGAESGVGTLAATIKQIYALATVFAGSGALSGVARMYALKIAGALAGSGALTGTTVAQYNRAASMTGTGALTSTARMFQSYSSASMTGSGALTSTGRMYQLYIAGTLAGSGAMSGTTVAQYVRAAALAGDGALTGAGRMYALNVAATLAGLGAITGTTVPQYNRAGALAGDGALTGAGSMYALNVGAALAGTGGFTATASPIVADRIPYTIPFRLAPEQETATLSGDGALTATAVSLRADVTVNFGGGGTLSATADFPTTAPAQSTYNGSSSGSWPIPYWCKYIDVGVLGGGGGGARGKSTLVYSYGNGAVSPASWNYTRLTRGVDIPWTTTSISFVAGNYGNGGSGSSNASGSAGGQSYASATGWGGISSSGGAGGSGYGGTQNGGSAGTLSYQSIYATGGTGGSGSGGIASGYGSGGAGGNGGISAVNGGHGSVGRVVFGASQT